MKKVLVGLFLIGFLFVVGCKNDTKGKPNGDELSGTITMSGAWALYPMAVKWAEQFQKIHPKVRIDISAGGAGKGMADALAQIVDIGNVSRDIYNEEIDKGAWWVAVTKDAVVPTINENNPVIKNLLSRGVDRETFISIWITENIGSWDEIVDEEVFQRINVYTRSDACGAAQTWAEFLGGKQEDLLGVGVYGDPGLAEAVKKDKMGIGYNNINYIYDSKTKKQVTGIKVLPIDINGNGKIDAEENFYSNRDEIVDAIATGKFPSPPARNLNFVCKGKPTKKVVVEFIKWVLTDGQKYVPETGYINLSKEKLKEELKKLEDK